MEGCIDRFVFSVISIIPTRIVAAVDLHQLLRLSYHLYLI